jgi:hypothetical protein
MKHMKQLPSACLRRFYYDTGAHNDELMMKEIRVVPKAGLIPNKLKPWIEARQLCRFSGDFAVLSNRRI